MGRLGIWEIVVILAVFILLFGAKKIPEIAAALGKAIGEFKKAGRETEESVTKSVQDDGQQGQS